MNTSRIYALFVLIACCAFQGANADLFTKDTLSGSLVDNATKKGPLGLYPMDQAGCKDHVLDFTEGKAIPYFGSTCYEKVQEGCCVGEASPINVGKSFLGLSTLSSCINVHKGRYCQATVKGEIAVGIRDDICFPPGAEARPDSMCEHGVSPGDVVPVTVHNNGCNGDTSWNKPVSEINGNLQAAMPLRHYPPGKKSYGLADYKTDTLVNYVVPEDACEGKTGGIDQYNFGTDGTWLQVTFKLKCKEDEDEPKTALLLDGNTGNLTDYAMTTSALGDAILVCDKPAIEVLIKRLEGLLKTFESARYFEAQADVIAGIREDLQRARDALAVECDQPVTGVGDGTQTAVHSGGPLIHVTTDSSEFCRYMPEKMTPVPVPGPGEDPRDVPVGGPVTPGSDDPRDTPVPPGGSDDPRDAPVPGGEDPKDKPGPGGGTITVTPGGGGGDDPRDKPTAGDDPRDEPTGGDDPRDTPTGGGKPPDAPPTKIYINVKATATAQTAGAAAQPYTKLQIKLYPNAVADPALPGSGTQKDTNTGAGDDPVQGITGDDGTTRIGANPLLFGITNGNTGNLILDINMDPTMTGVIAPAGTPVAGSSKPDETVNIAGVTYWVFYLPDAVAQSLIGGPIEINICIIKEPVGPGSHSSVDTAPARPIPGAALSLRDLQGERP